MHVKPASVAVWALADARGFYELMSDTHIYAT